jgi:hypothetical protein
MRSPSVISKAVIATTVVAGAVTFLVESQTVLIAQDGIPSQQRAPRSPYMGPAPAASPVERVGPNQVRIGRILIDTAKKELSVAGVVNDVNVLEFLANTKGGWKAYESALELETNAVNFNVACLLIGLDPAGAVVAKRQFDPDPPQGFPVDLFIEWEEGGRTRRVRAEQFLYNRMTRQTLSEGPWVYTGSLIYEVNRYLAETEGTLVGFMHTPSPVLENPRMMTEIGSYGDHIINPELNLKPGAAVTLVVRALSRTPPKK